MDWDDLRFFNAIATAGSVAKAAQTLGVAQPTVTRRVRDLEQKLGARLFDRLTSGYRMTEAGLRVFTKSAEVVRIMKSISDDVAGHEAEVAGVVRITASEGIGASWLAPRLGALRAQHPALVIDLELSTLTRDVAAGDADIALRMGEPGDGALVGRRIATIPFCLYASRGYVAKYGAPRDIEDLRRHVIIESSGRLEHVPQARLLRDIANGAVTVAALDNIFAQAAVAKAGAGLVGLPCYLGKHDPDLTRLLESDFHLELPVWVLTRPDLRQTARVRAVLDFIVAEALRTLPQSRQSLAREAV
ncbi:LysR family transcriptional regulator [Rubrimonas sp.]|uniref:LysR family transcriptional regulator n=1 Tax=Rubrimonas sp. TaxID=2036015 RepID=UPI002FDEEEEF